MRKITGCACARNAGKGFPRYRGLAIPTCITARAWRTCRDACRDRQLGTSLQAIGGENLPDIPGACATRHFSYLVRGQWCRQPEHDICIIANCITVTTVPYHERICGMPSNKVSQCPPCNVNLPADSPIIMMHICSWHSIRELYGNLNCSCGEPIIVYNCFQWTQAMSEQLNLISLSVKTVTATTIV